MAIGPLPASPLHGLSERLNRQKPAPKPRALKPPEQPDTDKMAMKEQNKALSMQMSDERRADRMNPNNPRNLNNARIEAQRDFTLHHNSGPGGNDYAANKAFSDMHQGMINKPGAFQYGQYGPLDYSDYGRHADAPHFGGPKPGTVQFDEMMRGMTSEQRGQYRADDAAYMKMYNATHGPNPMGIGGLIRTVAGIGAMSGLGMLAGGGLLGQGIASLYNNPLSQIARGVNFASSTSKMFGR